MRKVKGTPTELNLWVAAQYVNEGKPVPARVPPTEVPHLRRCIAAGFLEKTTDGTWKPTEAGMAAMREAKVLKERTEP